MLGETESFDGLGGVGGMLDRGRQDAVTTRKPRQGDHVLLAELVDHCSTELGADEIELDDGLVVDWAVPLRRNRSSARASGASERLGVRNVEVPAERRADCQRRNLLLL